MLTRTADHALRAVLWLAQHEYQGHVPADSIARALGAPPNYLAKTLQALAKAGVVQALRGPTGGFRLAVPADELTLFRVIEPFEDSNRRTVCLLGDRACDDGAPCAAHRTWTALVDHARGLLRRTTVADLLTEKPSLTGVER